MIITGKHLSRRTILRGLGAIVALPALDAMTPALAAAAGRRAAKAPLRMAFAYVPNGVTMEAWTPTVEGGGFEMSRILKPLAPMKDRMLVLSGLEHNNGNALGDGPGDHARAGAVFLTGVHCRKTAGADIKNGVSVDQIAARQVGLPDPARLDRARLRGHTRRRQLRLRLQLRLHQQPGVAQRDDAAAARDQPARGVRAPVRRRRRSRSGDAGAAAPQPPQHPRPRERAQRGAAPRPRWQRSPQAGRVLHRGARDRAAHPAGRAGRQRVAGRRSTSRAASRRPSRSTSR